MVGFSNAAADLVGLVDRSPMFVDTSLIAPISLDPIEKKERFALRARVNRLGNAQP
jgi:general secretion pathway protein L